MPSSPLLSLAIAFCCCVVAFLQSVPPIHFLPTVNYKANPAEYSCPVYKTSVRAGALSTTGLSTNFVLLVEMPTDEQPDRWVYQGTAMVSWTLTTNALLPRIPTQLYLSSLA